MTPEIFAKLKLIPLRDYQKIPYDKWNTDSAIPFKGDETGYGIDTGRSNLVVIDCDVKNGKDGISQFLTLSQKNGDDFPTTYTVATPNSGLHFYYKAPYSLQIKNSVSKLADGVDVRGSGGYIIGPNSKVKGNDGNIYVYEVQDEDAAIEDMPQWLINTLSKNETQEPTKSVKSNETVHSAAYKEDIEQKIALNWAIDKMTAAQDGERNSVLNHTAYFMGSKRVPAEASYELVTIAINSGLSKDEATSTFERAYQQGTTQEIPTFDSITKEYNTKTGTNFKDDPMDTEFYTHISLSYNFWLAYRSQFLFWNVDSNWYRYNSTTGAWKISKEEEIRQVVKEFLEKLVLEIREEKATKLPASVYKAQEKLWAKATIDATVVLARGDFLRLEENLFDNDPHLINCKNGVYDINSAKIIDHDPKLLITKHIPVNVNLEAKDEYCDKIIESIHPEERDFMQLIAGQSLLGEQPYNQTIFFLLGHGSNGKSTFINLMLKTSGSYSKLQPPSVFMQENGRENYALADFEGLRLAVVEELPDGKQLNAGALKRLVGTQRINSRRIYESHREFENQSTIFVSCNKLPMVNETDDGTWRRLVVVNFPYSYKKNASLVKNPETDKVGDSMVLFAANRKASTAEAFLAWRLKGAKKWLDDRHSEDTLPNSSEQTLKEWNENNDLFLAWFNECLTPSQDSFILLQDAFDSFNEFAVRRGNSKISQRFFTSNFKNHKTFRENKLEHLTRQRVKLWNHSKRYDSEGKCLEPAERNTVFVGVKFI